MFYPNPIIANQNFSIKGEFNKDDVIIMSDVNGKVVFEKTILNNQKEVQINIEKEALNNSVYFIRFINNTTNSTQVEKVIVIN